MMSSNSENWLAVKSATPACRHCSAVLAAVTWATNGLVPSRNWFRASDRSSDAAGSLPVWLGRLGMVHHLARNEEGQLRLWHVVVHSCPTAEPNAAGVVHFAKRVLKSADRQLWMPWL